jgi:hypothetical protein
MAVNDRVLSHLGTVNYLLFRKYRTGVQYDAVVNYSGISFCESKRFHVRWLCR